MIPCLALHHWSKFQTNLTPFGGVILKKPPKSSLKSTFLLLPQHLKVYNFGFTNGILMKLTTSMYKHDTFHLAKKLGRHSQGVGGRGRKTSEKSTKNQFFRLIFNNFQDYIRNFITYDTLCCTTSLVEVSKKSSGILGNYTQKTTPNELKIHHSGPTKTFANSYLGNNKCDTNKSYQDYVPP